MQCRHLRHGRNGDIDMRLISAVVLLAIVAPALHAASDTKTKTVQMDAREIVLIGFNNTTTFTLTLTAPAVGGATPVGSTNTAKRLRYTSCVPPSTTRQVQVSFLPGDQAPAGTSLTVLVTNVPANCGTANAVATTIGAAAQSIITGIGSCATGTAGASTPRLNYSFNAVNVSQIVSSTSVTVTVVYTLTDAS
jgi:hypothetical protein